jgi:hypothetical protein
VLRAYSRTGVCRGVVAVAAELEVVECVGATLSEWDAVMYLQSVGAAADDAGTVACVDLVTDLAPLPTRADPSSCLPVITLGGASGAVAAGARDPPAAEAVAR